MPTALSTQSDPRFRTEKDLVWRTAYSTGVGRTFNMGGMLLVFVEAHSRSDFVATKRAMNNGKSILIKAGFKPSKISEQDEQGLLVYDTRTTNDGQKFYVQVILSIPKP